MAGKWVDIKAHDGGTFKAYCATPPTGRGPGILMIQEIFGVNRHMRAVCDQYAMDGYTVLAPDIFWRIKPGIEIGYSDAELQEGIGYMQKMSFPNAVADMATTVKALRAMPECTGKVASVGYCMGGLLSYLAAANAGVDTAVCYYGVIGEQQYGEAAKIKCPIILHFAGEDKFVPMSQVEGVKKALASHKKARIDVYQGVDHGFNCWERGAYNQTAAALARGRTLSFLATEM
jgi:carboxymethylenebutenolidase